jgi:hypothetical protein
MGRYKRHVSFPERKSIRPYNWNGTFGTRKTLRQHAWFPPVGEFTFKIKALTKSDQLNNESMFSALNAVTDPDKQGFDIIMPRTLTGSVFSCVSLNHLAPFNGVTDTAGVNGPNVQGVKFFHQLYKKYRVHTAHISMWARPPTSDYSDTKNFYIKGRLSFVLSNTASSTQDQTDETRLAYKVRNKLIKTAPFEFGIDNAGQVYRNKSSAIKLSTRIMSNFAVDATTTADTLDPQKFAGTLADDQLNLVAGPPDNQLYLIPFIIIDQMQGTDTSIFPIELGFDLTQKTYLTSPQTWTVDPDT